MRRSSSPTSSPYRRLPGARPWIYGHRGARAHAPENTLEAFELALQQGADGVEIDVRHSLDGVLCIAHDPQVHVRSREEPVELSQLSSTQLRHLRLPSGHSIPTLEEVLQWKQERPTRINIELKGDVPAPLWMAERTVQLLERYGTEGIFLSSFSPAIVRWLSFRLPQVPAALLIHAEQPYLHWALPEAPLTPQLQTSEVQRRLAHWGPQWTPTALGIQLIHPESVLVTPERVQFYQAQQLIVNVWTVNDPKEAQRLASWGVDGLITDDPSSLLDLFV